MNDRDEASSTTDVATAVIDISVGLAEALPLWPGSPGVRQSLFKALGGGDEANATLLEMDVHTGTHIDAPSHVIETGTTVEAIDLESLNGPVSVVDSGDANLIGPETLEPRVPVGIDRLLLRTRNSARRDLYESPFYAGYAALSLAGAEWVRDRGIDVIGIDYLSIQRYGDPADTHRILLEAGVIVIEGLDLRTVVPGTYELLCLPIALAGAEAAPARVALRPFSRS